MSVDTTLDTAFTTLLSKFPASSGTTSGTQPPTTGDGGTTTVVAGLSTLNITFSGGGIALPTDHTLPGAIEIPGPLTLVWVHIYAGDETGAPVAVTAAISLTRTTEGTFGAAAAIYGATMPGLSGAAAADINISAWTKEYAIGDTILYRLSSFSGTATWLTLTMQMRPNVTAA